MNTETLQQQIDSFFDGTLSEQEEQALREYLTLHDVPEELQHDKRVILSLVTSQPVGIPVGLEERLSTYIDHLPKRKRITLFARPQRWVAGIAATILLALSVGIYYATTPRTLNEQELYACAEAQRALLLVSQKLNKGTDQWQQAQSCITKTNQIVNKHIKAQ